MVESFVDFLNDKLTPEMVAFVISMLPIFELRGGLVAAAILHVDWYIAFPLCVIGNLLPIPFELLFIRKIFVLLKKFKGFRGFIEKLEARASKKGGQLSQNKYLSWGLFILVAIPLPGTGAWTGGLVADFIDMRVTKAFPIIAAGVITAGLITSFVSYVIPMLF